jgi:hypothetical protein
MKVVLTLVVAGLVAFSQPSAFDELAKLFQNDPNQPADERIAVIQGRAGVRIFDYSFASPVRWACFWHATHAG